MKNQIIYDIVLHYIILYVSLCARLITSPDNGIIEVNLFIIVLFIGIGAKHSNTQRNTCMSSTLRLLDNHLTKA
jgi:hypothetical protein